VIYYGEGRQQMRELQASGGYLSFDSPVAHFGLGMENTVHRVEVRWSTGDTTELNRDFKAGARYVISRGK
jgi:ASPIC and UnbV